MMKILLTNDDGYDAVGLKALIKALTPIAKVMVVAPAKNKSACGHSLTLDKPLRLISVDDEYYKIDDATPTDCIYLSLGHLFKNVYRPDLVINNQGKRELKIIIKSKLADLELESGIKVSNEVEKLIHNIKGAYVIDDENSSNK